MARSTRSSAAAATSAVSEIRKRCAPAERSTKNRSNKKAKITTATRKNPKRILKPKALEDENGDIVSVTALNLQDIQKAQRTGKHPHSGSTLSRIKGSTTTTAAASTSGSKAQPLQQPKRKRLNYFLHTISSPAQRQIVYDRAAMALQDIETALLPSYGGRRWNVQVSVSDPTISSNTPNKTKKIESPYFVFGTTKQSKGALELAAWPQILSKIPPPPKFPGYYSSSESKELAKHRKKQQRRSRVKEGQTQHDDQGITSELNDAQVIGEDGKCCDAIVSAEEEEEDDDEDNDDSTVMLYGGEEWELILDLQERDITPLSRLAYKERGRVPLPNISIKWISPLREYFYTRKSAWDHAVQLCKQEALITRVVHGYDTIRNRALAPIKAPVLPPKKVLEAGWLRFQRDGLWVVGQEELWKEYSLFQEEENNIQGEIRPRPLTGLQYFIQCNRSQVKAKRQQELRKQLMKRNHDCSTTEENGTSSSTNNENAKTFTLRQADSELRDTWKTLTSEEKEEWRQKSIQQFDEEQQREETVTKASTSEAVTVASTPSKIGSVVRTVTPENGSGPLSAKIPRRASHGETGVALTAGDGSCVVEVSLSLTTQSWSIQSEKCGTESNTGKISLSSAEAEVKSSCNRQLKMASPKTSKTIPARKPAPWTKWCMNAEHVQLCYEAGMDHYDTVIATVKARDLHRELQDGFDVLRERGRGRFDMELPAFETPTFDFLNDLSRTPWMPVVRKILGDEAVLIHKGMFLSMPGAEAQPYHQDGPHLTTQTQRDCHAVNVFVPLVDLTLKHGPTEFCLGTHILGQEAFKAKFAETPLVRAGTPILFDYRLGHKGLANKSGHCRPIVYCTYAKSVLGKGEFRDKVNFSRSRYHRIGDLVSHRQIPSREERAVKRQQRIIEEQVW